MENPRDAISPSLSSPVHVHIDQDTPLYVHIVRKNLKQKERNQLFESYKLKEEQDGEKVMKGDSIKDSNHRLPICGLTRLPETSENAIHLLSNIFSPFQNKSEFEQTQLIVKQQQNEFAKLRSLLSQQEGQLKLFQQELNLLEKHSMAVQSSLILLQSQSEIFSETENKLPEPQDLAAKVADVEKQMKSSVATTAELEKSIKSWIPGMKEDSWWKKWMLSQHEQQQDLFRNLLDLLQSMKIGERSQSKKEELNINYKVETLECQKQALEDVKRHLQGELRSKESELERLKVQLKCENHPSLEEQKKIKFLSEEVQKNTAAEKEALKKAVKVQRQRADSNEELVKKMAHLAQEKVVFCR